jgi:hypothetical protein
MDQTKTEEMQNTPDLDRIMEDGRPAFAGSAEPPADDSGPVIIGHPGQGTPPAAEAEPKPPAKPAPAAAQPPTDTRAAADASPASPQPAVAPQEPVGKGPEAPRGDYRFKTLEEADKSYRLLQSEKTKADLRIRAMEEERTAKKDADARTAAVEAEDQQFTTFATERNKQALEEINALEPDDPDYTAKAAGCWTRANLAIRRWKPAASAGAAASAETTPRADGLAALGSSGKPAVGDRAGEAPAADATFTTKEFIEGVLEQAALGIPKDDPLFWSFAEQSPSVNEDGTQKEMKDQIWWAVERTLNYRRSIANPDAPAATANPPVAEATGLPPASPAATPPAVPMGRSGAFRPSGGSEPLKGPVSLAETLDSVMEMRRL